MQLVNRLLLSGWVQRRQRGSEAVFYRLPGRLRQLGDWTSAKQSQQTPLPRHSRVSSEPRSSDNGFHPRPPSISTRVLAHNSSKVDLSRLSRAAKPVWADEQREDVNTRQVKQTMSHRGGALRATFKSDSQQVSSLFIETERQKWATC